MGVGHGCRTGGRDRRRRVRRVVRGRGTGRTRDVGAGGRRPEHRVGVEPGSHSRARSSCSNTTSATPGRCAPRSRRSGRTSCSTSPRAPTCARRCPTRRTTRRSTSSARSTCSRPPPRSGVRRVVNTSTGGAIYSPAAPIPTPETAPVAPLSAYGLSKRVVEEYADWFRCSSGLDVVTLRYGNVYGPRQDPTGDAGVVAIFCERLLAGRPARSCSATARRPATSSTSATSRRPTSPPPTTADLPHRVYNVGTGTEVSIRELLRATAAAAGADPDAVVAVPAPPPARRGAPQLPRRPPRRRRARARPTRAAGRGPAPHHSTGSAADEMTRTLLAARPAAPSSPRALLLVPAALAAERRPGTAHRPARAPGHRRHAARRGAAHACSTGSGSPSTCST